MYSVSLDTDTRVFENTAEAVRRAPRTVDTYVNKTLRPNVESRALKRLQTKPRLPTHPFIWSRDPVKQARARRWYFANMVNGNGDGRYPRTDTIIKAWSVVFRDRTLTLTNDADGVEYVQGDKQVVSHDDSGWVRADDVVLEETVYAEEQLTQFWLQILDDKPGTFA